MEKENDETNNYRKDNDLISEKHKTVYMTLNYLAHFVVFVSVVSGCVAISVFRSLVCDPFAILSSVVGLKICSCTTLTIIKKKKKK